ncbi:MAG: TlpA disulfide reductase family protein [Candidatus Pseudobacter hemicellulosilyticus]|uniref:TlpA disulfide reductase family protein n=1 Tax=Candidatus Pseudobacter hemicellulosilyticus TaxID=3121375 RepID=A0AAJ5WSQ1_9BACT|nr:MAG: TlpA disulfide reductase family protein [Pseudobacter sp.]
MKTLRYPICLLILFNCLSAFSQQTVPITLSGIIKGGYTGKVYLSFNEYRRAADTITAEVQDGHFTFKQHISLPVRAMIHLESPSHLPDFFIDQPNTTMDCTYQLNTYNSGKDTMRLLNLDTVRGSKMEAVRNDFLRSVNLKIDNSLEGIEQASLYFDKLQAFIQANPASKLSAHLLSKCDKLDYKQLLALYSLLDSGLYSSSEMKFLNSLMSSREKLNRGLLDPGTPVYDTTFLSDKDQPAHFSDLKGNCFLVVFWGSYCAPCRREIPELKELDRLYRDKGLTLVSISIEASKEKWQKALAEEKMPWAQWLDREAQLYNYYGLHGVPCLFLLDKDKKIIAWGQFKELRKKVEELMQ